MRISIKHRQDGGALAITLITAIAIGVILASYLDLISSRYKITVRSQCWNESIAVAEQGIEEAMTHLHVEPGTPTANKWTVATVGGLQAYSKTRTNANGSYFLSYLFFSDTNKPYVYSTGFIPSPLQDGAFISRTVRVNATNPPLFSFAFAAIYNIKMNGSGLAANSFDSSKTNLSTNGQYDPAKTSTNGNVASVYGPVNFGNHTIDGNLSVGPEVGTNSVGSGQVSGQIYTDFNVSFPDATLPANTTFVSKGTTSVNGAASYDFSSSGSYSISGNSPIIVEPGVTAVVRVDATTFNPASVHIVATNGVSGNLIIYQVSGSVTLGGGLTVDSGRARYFTYYGLPGVTSITYGGNTAFVGSIYAPEADLTLNGGGSNPVNLAGAFVVKTLTVNGKYNFHFDEDLLTAGPYRGFVASSWQEL